MLIMRIFSPRLAAVFVLCACSDAVTADDGALGLKPDGGGIQLKLQSDFVRIPASNRDPVPLFIDANNVQGHQDVDIEAEGEVRLRKRGKAVFADWLRYDQAQSEVHARGNVRLEQRGDSIEGTELNFNIDTERGAMEKPNYRLQINATQGRGEGDRLVFEGESKYRMLAGSYTTCDVGVNDWFIRAKDFEVDKERQIGTARNASVEFMGKPILYSPYLSFSLDRERKSGFLAPTFGQTGNSGTEFSLPYYWNIAPNRDATITPRVMTKRGVQLRNEFRYLDPTYRGELRYEILPDDRVRGGDTRSALSVVHNQNFANGWVGALNVQRASDNNYFTDLSNQISATSQILLPRAGSLAKGGALGADGSWGFSTSVQRWQTLQTDPLNPVTVPYSALQANLTATKPFAGIADTALQANVTEFTHPTQINGTRAIVYPSVSLPLQTSFGYVTPKVGMHMTHYNFDNTNTGLGDQNRLVPILSADSGVVFERDMQVSGHSMTQTIEPKIFYVYIPTRNQNSLPVFDSALQNTNFATLYTENQFSGSDRINDANQVTTGVTSRILQPNGIERLRAGIAQRFYFKTQEVTLPGVAPRGSNTSDLLAALNGLIVENWFADAGFQYTTNQSQTQRLNAGVRYEPERGKVVNVAYRYTNGSLITATGTPTTSSPDNPSNTLRQADISTQWPISRQLTLIGRMNYSIADSRMLEGLAGLEYNGGCWAVRVVAHSFATTSTTSINSFFMQLELNGVSKIGSNPLELLRRNIGGYYRGAPQVARPDDNSFPLR